MMWRGVVWCGVVCCVCAYVLCACRCKQLPLPDVTTISLASMCENVNIRIIPRECCSDRNNTDRNFTNCISYCILFTYKLKMYGTYIYYVPFSDYFLCIRSLSLSCVYIRICYEVGGFNIDLLFQMQQICL